MPRIADIGPGQLFGWDGGIFVKSDTTKIVDDTTRGHRVIMWAVTLIKVATPRHGGLSTDNNRLGASVWMDQDKEVILLTADIYYGDRCIHRMWENEIDNLGEPGILRT